MLILPTAMYCMHCGIPQQQQQQHVPSTPPLPLPTTIAQTAKGGEGRRRDGEAGAGSGGGSVPFEPPQDYYDRYTSSGESWSEREGRRGGGEDVEGYEEESVRGRGSRQQMLKEM